jgi:hypothetical protein
MLLLLLALLVATPPIASGSGLGITRDPSGVGLQLPGRAWLSGDLTLSLDVPEGEPIAFELDDVSLLARWDPFDRLGFFSELRLEDVVEVVEGEGVQTGGGRVVPERLYADVLLAPAFTLRLGKVFTPFGLWNVINRTPFTWTVEAPAITEDVFPQRATGVSLLYQTTWRGWSVDATTYAPAQDAMTFGRADETQRGLLFGGRVAAGRTLGQTFGRPVFGALGVNAAGFRDRDTKEWRTATGLDLQGSVAGHEVTGELTWRLPENQRHLLQGLYLQDAIPLVGKLYGVLRFEYFQPPRGAAAVGQVVGLFWRPTPNLVLRADYLFGTRRLENFEPGFRASVSVLF